MKLKSAILITFLFVGGCDSIYKYVFLPSERIEYTLVPDKEAIDALQDSNYFISKDGQAVGYDMRTWKFEIRYMSDYQLNTFEFPEESKAGEFSGNPYTYGNWIDPEFGYSPRRFSVFKVTIYNYTASKLNFDPELTLLQTDRGDNFNAYAREQKNAKYFSIEEYFKRRKGTSGVDEEIFETRMGIARRTMLYYGKPIYKGDSRDGLVVYDPIVNEVEKLKINISKFITGYDENNEPSEFIDLNFFFKQVPLDKSSLGKLEIPSISSDTTKIKSPDQLKGEIKIAQLKYIDDAQSTIFLKNKFPQIKDVWNPNPAGMENLIEYINSNSSIKTTISQVTPAELELKDYDLLILTGVGTSPVIDQDISTLVEFIGRGGLIIFDICNLKEGTASSSIKHFQSVSEKLSGKVQMKEINIDHPILNLPKKLNGMPAGYESINGNVEPAFQMRGIFLEGKLVGIETGRSYSMLWNDNANVQALDLGINIAAFAISNRKK